VQFGLAYLDTVGEPEAALEPPRGDAPVDIIAGPLIRLLAAYDQLAALDGDGKLIDAEPCDR
jgi:hypothetical protein